jgi:diaminopimelate decarboxylase
LDNSIDAYQADLAKFYCGHSGVTYAAKAFLCLALAKWIQQHGLCVDCSSLGDIATCVAAGIPREQLLVHGVNKSTLELESACDHVGVIVVDNLSKLQRIIEISHSRREPDLWLRFQPGLAVETHGYTQTGQAGRKFGMDSAEILQAAQRCREHTLSLTGLHFHQGSQFWDPAPRSLGIKHTLDLAQMVGFGSDWNLSPGGMGRSLSRGRIAIS